MTAFDFVFSFSGSARVHDKLYRDFAALARDIARAEEVDEVKLAMWSERRLEIETEEPGIMDWLERFCAWEEAKARGAEVNNAWRLPRWKVTLSQFLLV